MIPELIHKAEMYCLQLYLMHIRHCRLLLFFVRSFPPPHIHPSKSTQTVLPSCLWPQMAQGSQFRHEAPDDWPQCWTQYKLEVH